MVYMYFEVVSMFYDTSKVLNAFILLIGFSPKCIVVIGRLNLVNEHTILVSFVNENVYKIYTDTLNNYMNIVKHN